MSETDAPKPSHQIAELKVSGHTMALDPGLYCVFSAPNSTVPAVDSGLPTVRISAAPGRPAGRVDIAGLGESGWIGPDSATLVRIADARSNVLVTVYQAKDAGAEAPQIQVVRLSAESGAPVATAELPAPAPDAAKPQGPRTVHVVAHIYGRGDVGGELGEWMGEPGSKRWIEGFAVAPVGDVPAADLEYQAVLGRGWLSPWASGGQFCGSRSMALPILGLRVRLRGASAASHRVVLSATFIDGSEVGPVGDGEACEASSLAALEAFHLAFEPMSAKAAAGPASAGRGRAGAKKPAVAPTRPAPGPTPAARGTAKQSASQPVPPIDATPQPKAGRRAKASPPPPQPAARGAAQASPPKRRR